MSAAKTPKTSKGESTRSAIVSRALALASVTGLESLSLQALATAVGMSKSGLFAHFASKEDLQLQVLKEAADRFVSFVVAPALKKPRGVPRIRALFENWLEWAHASFQPGGCVFQAAAAELDDKEGPAREYLVATQRDLLSTMATAAKIAVQEGHFAPDLDVDQWAYEVYGIVIAYHQVSRLLRDETAEARARRSFEALLERSKR